MVDQTKITHHLIKKLVIIYVMLFPAFVAVALFLNHIEKYNFAKDLSFSQRNNLFIKDFRNVNTALQALSSKYNRIDFVINNEIQFTSINQEPPKWYYKKLQIHLYSDIEEKSELGHFVFYYNYLIAMAYAALSWIICMLFLYPSYLIQKNLFFRNLKISKLEAYEDLAKQVAHDLKSPLQALEAIATNTEDLEKSNQQLNKIIKRITNISQDLFNKKYNDPIDIKIPTSIVLEDPAQSQNINKFYNSKPKEVLTNMDLKTIIHHIIQEKKIIFSEIDFELENFLDCDFSFYFYKIELERILSNLLNNSIEAIKEKLVSKNKESTESKIQITLITTDNKLVIRIFDTGIGIEKEKIYSVFEKGISYKTSNERNNGLGLYHAKKTIEAADGQIKFFSVLNQFTTVEIEIPLTL